MKHNLKITLLLVLFFLVAQFIGLYVIHVYETKELPYNIERPEFEEETSYIPIIIAIAIASFVAYLLARVRAFRLWKFWFFISIIFCLLIAFSAFFNQIIALFLALILAIFKVFRSNIVIHNLGEVFLYAGLAGLFVPIFGLTSITILLIVILIYDAIAVWKTKHMITLAKFQTQSKLFAGFHITYGKKKDAILGGGDIGFPLIFAGVVLNKVGWYNAIFVVIFCTIALGLLLLFSKKNKFYPAMPFLSLGCFLGFLFSLISF